MNPFVAANLFVYQEALIPIFKPKFSHDNYLFKISLRTHKYHQLLVKKNTGFKNF